MTWGLAVVVAEEVAMVVEEYISDLLKEDTGYSAVIYLGISQ